MSECILATRVYDINVRLFKENVCVHFCDAGVDMYFCDVIMRVIKGAIVDTCTHAHMLLALGTKLDGFHRPCHVTCIINPSFCISSYDKTLNQGNNWEYDDININNSCCSWSIYNFGISSKGQRRPFSESFLLGLDSHPVVSSLVFGQMFLLESN